MPVMSNEQVTLGSADAGCGQFRCRRRSVAVAKAGRWLVFCTKLSVREQEVLRCMLDGMSILAIAAKFSRAISTVSAQKNSAFRKLGLRTNHELFKLRYLQG